MMKKIATVAVWLTCLFYSPTGQAQHFNFKRTDTTLVIQGSDTLKHPWVGGMSYCQFNRIDMDLDGKKDLLVFDRAGNQLIPFRYLGGAGLDYEFHPEYATYFPSQVNSWVLLKDYNCDGKEDLFTYFPGGTSIYKNVSDTILKFELVVQMLRSHQLGLYLNVLITSVDIPAIVDVDDDTDLDFIIFGQFGKYIEYHKNYSVEYGYGCDSLTFIMKNQCWGNFHENASNCSITLFDTCEVDPLLPGPPEMTPLPAEYRAWFSSEAPGYDLVQQRSSGLHTGSSLLVLDLNGQNTKDLLVGDVSCNTLTGLMNGGAVPNTNTSMISQDPTFPSYDVPVDIPVFPAAFHLDLDNDSLRDLIVSPFSQLISNNYSGNWFYKNTGTDLTPVFTFDHSSLFQQEMIENGESSVPVFFDHNGDGLQDLVIANFGFWNTNNFTYDRHVSQMRMFLNTGTLSHPVFTLSDTNYLPIVFSSIDTTGLCPTFGDLDGDGDKDLIVGDIIGRLHRFVNTAGPGNPASFALIQNNMQDVFNVVIDVGTDAAPHLVDIDRDGDNDMLVGKQNGRITYYENVGTTTAPAFRNMDNSFGQVQVNESWSTIGNSKPYVYDDNGKYHLFVGSLKGKVYHYDSIDNNLTGDFRLLDSLPDQYSYFGPSSAPAVIDLTDDTLPEMVIGNIRGGLLMYTAVDTLSGNSISENQPAAGYLLQVYPNPAQHLARIRTDLPGKKQLEVYAIDGRKIHELKFKSQETEIDLSPWAQGMYVLRLQSLEDTSVLMKVKLIKQ